VVTFHSSEDRVVKRFFQQRSGRAGRANRYAPEAESVEPTLRLAPARAIEADETELARNPRARSARLRVARRTTAPLTQVDRTALGLPPLVLAETQR